MQIDVLINNASIGSSWEFAENDLKSELDIIQINCTSLTSLTHLFLQDMKQRKSGTAINLGSMIAFTYYVLDIGLIRLFFELRVKIRPFVTKPLEWDLRQNVLSSVLATPV
ncbi:SDR family NAD(P)-dependent oxidoreductase [Xanthocytophaga flavus]|uniref:SDR family NAD(P)-dependent oxidoreductase n=1 Tax=Xanthocytophaga flava TaxID=3048013 RepID=UPI00391FC70E